MRLIDGNELKRRVIAFATGCNATYMTVDNIIMLLNQSDTVETVEVVRCKDCIHWDKDFLWCDRKWGRTAEDDFCSYGERKDNETV